MTSKFTTLLGKAVSAVFGTDAAQSDNAPEIIEMDRKALTIAVIDDFETKKRTGDSIAHMWDNIADLMIEGLGPKEELSEEKAQFVDSIQAVAQAARDTNTFSDTIPVSQKDIDILFAGRDMVYAAKESIKEKVGDLPDGAKGEYYIAEDDMGEEQLHRPISEFEQAIMDRQNQLAMFAFKLESTFKQHKSPNLEHDGLHL